MACIHAHAEGGGGGDLRETRANTRPMRWSEGGREQVSEGGTYEHRSASVSGRTTDWTTCDTVACDQCVISAAVPAQTPAAMSFPTASSIIDSSEFFRL